MIVDSQNPVTLLGGAQIKPDDITFALKLAPDLVVADSGADAALAAGLVPRAVIGDMDSLSARARREFAAILHPVAEQDSTDFDKALRHIAAPVVVALGFSGGRLDHELAALHGIVANPGRPCVIFGPESLAFVCPPRLALDLAAGTVVSLFPMARARVASTGLRWRTDGLDFAPDARIGTSNEALGGPVTLTAEAPAMLVILPRETLAQVVSALGDAALERWPGGPPSAR